MGRKRACIRNHIKHTIYLYKTIAPLASESEITKKKKKKIQARRESCKNANFRSGQEERIEWRAPRQREKETGTKDTKRRRKKRRETVYFWNSWNEVKGRVVARQRIRMEYILMDDRPTYDFVTVPFSFTLVQQILRNPLV